MNVKRRERIISLCCEYLEQHKLATAKDISYHVNLHFKWGYSAQDIAQGILSRSSLFAKEDRYSMLNGGSGHNLWRLA